MATTEVTVVKADGQPVAWYSLSPEDATTRLRVEPASGLPGVEAASRLAGVGPNKFAVAKTEPRWHAFLRQ